MDRFSFNNGSGVKILSIFFLLMAIYSSIFAISMDDITFCYHRELWEILSHYEPEIREFVDQQPEQAFLYNVLEDLAIRRNDDLALADIMALKVLNLRNLSDAYRLLSFFASSENEELVGTREKREVLLTELFNSPGERLIINWASGKISEEQLFELMSPLPEYPSFFEDYIQSYINNIAVERSDSLRIALSEEFSHQFPASNWQDTNIYFYLISLLNLERYYEVVQYIEARTTIPPVLSYLTAGLLIDSNLRKNYRNGESNLSLLDEALRIILSVEFPEDLETVKVIYQNWDRVTWEQKITLQKAKITYFKIISAHQYWGDEDIITALLVEADDLYLSGLDLLKTIQPVNNDYGEMAELNYWLGRYAILLKNDPAPENTAEYFIDCLIAGAPRKRFDTSALKYLEHLHKNATTTDDLITWNRKIKNYQGPIFTDVTDEAGFEGLRFTRVSVGDYNNDGKPDLLFNGHRLFRNEGNFRFTEVTENVGITNHSFTGGLWADFDKDGHLDFVALSSSREEAGDTLYRNRGDGSFEELRGEFSQINDFSPTEGAAWIDFERTGYPSLYSANYELWQVQTGFQDFFWYNDRGKFSDKTTELGFLKPSYTKNPGLAGRGVSPADYNNDGIQSIFVSNYRLNRNYLWDYQQDEFIDHASLYGVAGHRYAVPDHYGYYGHTIGADWGDYNNDGRLDIFIANLAHPRFIEFSDISMLLRNDGVTARSIGDKVIIYHQFTDVTAEAGITYDELHSDPNWFDTNNNGYLDLFITSVYENDRSYLYLNNQDGTFTDITWLSGVRVYNGWGNAVADLNNDGRVDLIVGSGNGTRIFRNDTDNEYRAKFYKPYWDGEEVRIVEREDWNPSLPNSPAFGSRVQVRVVNADGDEQFLIRELNGGKGTTSQNDQFLHFGIGENILKEATIWLPDK